MSRDGKKKLSKKTVTAKEVVGAISDKKIATKRSKKVIEEIIEDPAPIPKKTTKRTTPTESKIDSKKKKSDDKPAPVNETKSNLTEINFDLDEKVFNYKISSWNVAGLRAWIKKDGLEYIHYEKPDILCLQVRFFLVFPLRMFFIIIFFSFDLFNYLGNQVSCGSITRRGTTCSWLSSVLVLP